MITYTTRNKYFIIILVTSIIFIFVNIVLGFVIQKLKLKTSENIFFFKDDSKQNININQNESQSCNSMQSIPNELENNNKKQDSKWQIIIPQIALSAPIHEGTSQKVIKSAVGHFENSSKWDGNVALAAHNRGYKSNYFQNIKDLQLGDKIIYVTQYGKREYKVDNIVKIKDTDWEYVKNTNTNKITLITCIENMPGFRLCVQGIEV